MPTVFTHAIAALGLGACFYRPEVPKRVWALGALYAALPDADVAAFAFEGVTYHLAKGVASDLHGKAAYTRTRGLDPIRYAEMVKAFVADHGSITPKECRALLGLGESKSAKVEVSRRLRAWSGPVPTPMNLRGRVLAGVSRC